MSLNNRGGRPRKPAELHRLHGSYRKDRHGPLPPSSNGDETNEAGDVWLEPTDPQALEFYKLLLHSPVGVAIRATDSAALTLAAETWVLLNKAVDAARGDPMDVAARSAVVAYAGVFDRLCSRFGLTPSDRARLRITEPPPASKLDRFLDGGIARRNRDADE
jgi:hypothetical protein